MGDELGRARESLAKIVEKLSGRVSGENVVDMAKDVVKDYSCVLATVSTPGDDGVVDCDWLGDSPLGSKISWACVDHKAKEKGKFGEAEGLGFLEEVEEVDVVVELFHVPVQSYMVVP